MSAISGNFLEQDARFWQIFHVGNCGMIPFCGSPNLPRSILWVSEIYSSIDKKSNTGTHFCSPVASVALVVRTHLNIWTLAWKLTFRVGLWLYVDCEGRSPIHVVSSHDVRKNPIFPESVPPFRVGDLLHILYVAFEMSVASRIILLICIRLHSLYTYLANRLQRKLHCKIKLFRKV